MPEKPAELPVQIIVDAMTAAKQGEQPPFDRAGLLDIMQLSGETPDGLTMLDRLVGPNDTLQSLRAVAAVKRGANTLIDLTNRYEANPAQESLMRALGGVAERQIIREQFLCPVAAGMIRKSTRNDLIDPQVRALLAARRRRPDYVRIGPLACPPWKAR